MFALPDDLPRRPDSLTPTFTKLVRQCGLPAIRLHDLRRGACSLLVAGGVPIEVVQQILGHSTPDVTHQVYTHVMRGRTGTQVAEASRLLSRHLDPTTPSETTRVEPPGPPVSNR